jgi:uroporphyrinogen-III decarboxylase
MVSATEFEPYRGEPDKERLLAAMRRRPVDRVPNVEVLIEDRIVERMLGRQAGNTIAVGGDPAKGMSDADKVRPMHPADYLEICRMIGQDTLLIEALWTPFKMRDSQGKAVPISGKPVKCRADFDSLIMPTEADIEAKIRFVREYKEAVKGTRIGVGVLFATFVMTINEFLMDLHDFFIACVEDRPFIEHMLDVSTDYWVRFSRALVKEKIDWCYTGDDFGYKTGLFLPPALLKELWFTRYRRIMDPLKDAGTAVMCHSDGKIDEMVPWLIDYGVDALNPLDPYCVDYRDYKRRFGGRIALWGNIDLTFPLSLGKPADVEKDVREHMEIMKPGYGYICSSSHSIVNYIPYENWVTMVNAIHAYGNYEREKTP